MIWTEDDIISRLSVTDDTVSIICADEAREIAGAFEELRKDREELRIAIERKVEKLREALKGVLLDVDFMVERDVIPDIRNDIIYERARAALKETE